MTRFGFRAYDPTPGMYPPPFLDRDRLVVYESESVPLLKAVRKLVKQHGVRVWPIVQALP